MKKYLAYIIVLLVGVGVFLLQFRYGKKYNPKEYYQVYLDNEKIGVIKSKEELNNYIKSQGAVVKEQVEEYSIDVERVKTVEEILKNIIKEDSVYYSKYQESIRTKALYKKLFNLVGDTGKIKDNYNEVIKVYNTMNKFNSNTSITMDNIVNYDTLKNNINSYIKANEKDIINYIYENRNTYDLTSTQKNSLEEYVSNNLFDLDYTKYLYMSTYIDENNMYLYADNVYEPLGINIKSINTYNDDYTSVEEVYNKIIGKKPCTIEGYQFKIKKSAVKA